DRAIERGLREHAPNADVTFERVAIQAWQIEAWNLPTRPTKKTDSRSKGFEGDSVEVDAIEPASLRELVANCIAQHGDGDALKILREAEASEREILTRLCEQISGSNDGA